MKEMFRGFYNADESTLKELWSDEKTLFVFDTNVLLNLYGYAKKTREDFFEILDAVNDRLWIPYHVGLEYQMRRLEVIKKEKAIFGDVEKNLEKIQGVFKNDFERLALKRRFPKLHEKTKELEKSINKDIADYKKSVSHWNGEQPCVRSHDKIRDRLNELFEGKVGEKPTDQKWLDDLYKEGEDRFSKNVPPGFEDDKKGERGDDSRFVNDGLLYERKYGDLIIWKQLIDKSRGDNVENVFLVTDETKEDWWYKVSSNGRKTIGPLAELQSEIYRESGIKNFHMYSASMFLEDGKTNLAVNVSESSIEDASVPYVLDDASHLSDKFLDYYKLLLDSAQMEEFRTRASARDEQLTDLFFKNHKDSPSSSDKLSKVVYFIDSKDVKDVDESNYYVNRRRLKEAMSRGDVVLSEKLRKEIIDMLYENDEDDDSKN